MTQNLQYSCSGMTGEKRSSWCPFFKFCFTSLHSLRRRQPNDRWNVKLSRVFHWRRVQTRQVRFSMCTDFKRLRNLNQNILGNKFQVNEERKRTLNSSLEIIGFCIKKQVVSSSSNRRGWLQWYIYGTKAVKTSVTKLKTLLKLETENKRSYMLHEFEKKFILGIFRIF